MSRFREVTRSCGEEYICSLITGSGLVATANGGGLTVSTLLQSLFNIRVPATSRQRHNKLIYLMMKLSHALPVSASSVLFCDTNGFCF